MNQILKFLQSFCVLDPHIFSHHKLLGCLKGTNKAKCYIKDLHDTIARVTTRVS